MQVGWSPRALAVRAPRTARGAARVATGRHEQDVALLHAHALRALGGLEVGGRIRSSSSSQGRPCSAGCRAARRAAIPSRAAMMSFFSAPMLFTSLAGKPLYIVSSTNTWQSASMCEVAMPWNEMPMKSSAVSRSAAERGERVARDEHVVLRGHRILDRRRDRESRASSSP
jgi:hypothetical protein